ncbi:TonB family protein [Novosphingobium gossypii]|uniref:TonB family protein n=1 Tax=Novosphingobium gossypii TaxID=1604774 RepID=UPI003D20B6D5
MRWWRSRSGHSKPRWSVAAVVLLIHLGIIAGLIRAFTPDVADRVVRSATQAFTIDAPPPAPPPPAPDPPAAAQPRAADGAPAAKATPRPAAIPRAPVVIVTTQAPPVVGQGTQNAAGASAQGAGTGALGSGMGSGAGGTGTGAGRGSSPTVKIAGNINSAKDYPRRTRDLRIDASVTVEVAVGADGRPTACRIAQPSPDAEADRITCRLAMDRFRFRPATDAMGNPTTAVYRWRQRWFY